MYLGYVLETELLRMTCEDKFHVAVLWIRFQFPPSFHWTHFDPRGMFIGRWHFLSFGAGLCSSPRWGYELSNEYHVLALQSDEELIADALRSCLESYLCYAVATWEHVMFLLHSKGCLPNKSVHLIIALGNLESFGLSLKKNRHNFCVCEP